MEYKFLTKEVLERMAKYPLYSQDGKGADAIVTAKFFYPAGAWTWYVLEYDGEDTFFGIVFSDNGLEGEYGYFSRNELESLRGMWGLGVERDKFFNQTELGKSSDYYLKRFVDEFFS